MTSYIAVGSNIENRLNNLKSAYALLENFGYNITGVAPVYETPAALLYETAQDSFNKPYLNTIFKIETNVSAFKLLEDLKVIEQKMGRNTDHIRWSPRTIDLDIIKHNNENINTEKLTVPHKLCMERSFVLDPLSWFEKVDSNNLYVKSHQSMIMGILNITPDSFSGDGKLNKEEDISRILNEWIDANVQIIDVGAQSTRPGATMISEAEELQRLNFVFDFVNNFKKNNKFRTSFFSIDTFYPLVARKALEVGFDIINDVKGFENKDMMNLAHEYKDKYFIFNHNENISNLDLKDTVKSVHNWALKKIDEFNKNDVPVYNTIFDVGIGFNKNACQSLQLIQNIEHFYDLGVRIMIGHSRKSFMKVFCNKEANNRDIETLALSTVLSNKVDILRVHKPIEHLRNIVASAHVLNQFY
ncbi:MAG: dihydropteroate synthase [Alphaproteobacteria bacterium]|nr:dihydropteroate synthase [Alphaproteobacteria bacterium]